MIVLTATEKPKQKTLQPFPIELIDQLLASVENKDADSIFGASEMAGQDRKMLADRLLSRDWLTFWLVDASKNYLNGIRPQRRLAPSGKCISMCRTRLSSFASMLAAKHQRVPSQSRTMGLT